MVEFQFQFLFEIMILPEFRENVAIDETLGCVQPKHNEFEMQRATDLVDEN